MKIINNDNFKNYGILPDVNGPVMIRYKLENYQLCDNAEKAIQWLKDMFPVSAHEMFTLIYWC